MGLPRNKYKKNLFKERLSNSLGETGTLGPIMEYQRTLTELIIMALNASPIFY